MRITRSFGRALCDHVAIRQRMDSLRDDNSSELACLHELGRILSDHVRLEERELFVLIEHTLPGTDLAAVARALQDASDGR